MAQEPIFSRLVHCSAFVLCAIAAAAVLGAWAGPATQADAEKLVGVYSGYARLETAFGGGSPVGPYGEDQSIKRPITATIGVAPSGALTLSLDGDLLGTGCGSRVGALESTSEDWFATRATFAFDPGSCKQLVQSPVLTMSAFDLGQSSQRIMIAVTESEESSPGGPRSGPALVWEHAATLRLAH